jgi:DNA-binding MarR family transcriptional regulator
VQRTPVIGPPAPLTARTVVQTMAEPYRRALAQRLGGVDLGHLATLAAGGAPGLRVRPADVAQRTGLAKASVTELLARLEAKGAVRYDSAEGRNTYYRLRPDTEIAFGLM